MLSPLWYLFVRPQLGRLATENASEETKAVAQGLVGAAAAVVEGWRYATAQDYPALARLDSALALSRVTDVWYADAVQLRADLRITVANPSRELAQEALDLIDRVLVIAPQRDLFFARAASAVALENGDVLIESVRLAAASSRQEIRRAKERDYALPTQAVEPMRRGLTFYAQQLDGDLVKHVRGRAQKIRHDVDRLVEHLDAYSMAR